MTTVVTGCTPASGGSFCITVTKGRKNPARHRQWLVSIHMWSSGTLCLNGWEAWTQNWYMAPAGRGCYSGPLTTRSTGGPDEQLRLRARLLQHDECHSLHRDSGLVEHDRGLLGKLLGPSKHRDQGRGLDDLSAVHNLCRHVNLVLDIWRADVRGGLRESDPKGVARPSVHAACLTARGEHASQFPFSSRNSQIRAAWGLDEDAGHGRRRLRRERARRRARAHVRRAAAGDAALDLRRRHRASSIGYGPATAWTRDFDELLQDEDLDAIAFASAELAERGGRALAALECEKHVFVDGLLDSSSGEADKLVAAAARGGRRLLAQAPALLRPEVLRLHRLIDRGALGEIFDVHARRYALRPDLDLDLLRDLGLEQVALTLDLLGDEPVEAEAHGESYLGRQRPDVIFAKLSFATGIGVYLHLSCLEGESAERISVVGSKATAVLDAADPERALSVYVNGSTPSMFDELPVEPGDKVAFRQAPEDALRLACSRFLTAVRSHGDTSFGREASAALAVVEALELSCRTAARPSRSRRAPPRPSRT